MNHIQSCHNKNMQEESLEIDRTTFLQGDMNKNIVETLQSQISES